MIKKFENFINESNEKKRDDKSATNLLKSIVRNQFYDYLSHQTLKKHNDNEFDNQELIRYLKEMDLGSEEYYRIFKNILHSYDSPYTLEEFKKISEILINVFGVKRIGGKNREYVLATLKILFKPLKGNNFERDYEDKLDALRVNPRKYWGHRVGDKDIPIVIGINGKALTGEVYYNKFLDIYTETEDEMLGAIDNFISSSLYKSIEMIDDYNIDDFSQVKNYNRVNLDK